VGAVAGAAIGGSVDMTVNAGVALMQRSAFVEDVRESLNATQSEWEDRLWPELERVQSVWFGHADEALLLLQVEEEEEDNSIDNK
jgi:hypothetical protein